MSAPTVVDLFAGPGGWDESALALGIRTLGVEWDASACATATAAGHERLCADVAALDPVAYIGAEGLIASPPCTDFSTAGGMRRTDGSSGHLVAEVMRWAEVLLPEWVACEQVPQVLPIWQHYAWQLRGLGYSTWAGILNAADYGVPQERQRAVLLASRTINVTPPTPTHAQQPESDLWGEQRSQWRTMAETVGLPTGCEYDSGQNSRGPGGTTVRYVRSCDRPAGTVTGQTTNQWVIRSVDGTPVPRKLTLSDSAALQGFRRDYPWHGTTAERNQQVGNAVPPPLAAHILAGLAGVSPVTTAAA